MKITLDLPDDTVALGFSVVRVTNNAQVMLSNPVFDTRLYSGAIVHNNGDWTFVGKDGIENRHYGKVE